MDGLVALLVGFFGLAAGIGIMVALRRIGARAPEVAHVRTDTVAERVRAVGKLVGLEVHAKEIATGTKGWAWLPPLLLTQAKVAMIFHFEKQYYVDLGRLGRGDVEALRDGTFRLRLPEIEGALRLTDVTPYDIQAGRVLGLVDVIQMNAPTQKRLMQAAQEQAAELFARSDEKYDREARRSIERHVQSLCSMVGARVELVWPDEHRAERRRTGSPDAHPRPLPSGHPVPV